MKPEILQVVLIEKYDNFKQKVQLTKKYRKAKRVEVLDNTRLYIYMEEIVQ